MIELLKGHITQNQINTIVDIIMQQYLDYVRWSKDTRENYPRLFRNEYKAHKKQYSISWAISSAFPEDEVVAGNLKVHRQEYSGGHVRPRLENERIVIHILNGSTDFKADYLSEYYAYNKHEFKNDKLYCYIKFKVQENSLRKLELCLPDEYGIVHSSEMLRRYEQIKLYVA